MIKLSRIVCPSDFSQTSSRAVDYAATMAVSLDAELIVLHVIPQMDYPLRSFGISGSFEHIQEELTTRAEENLAERIKLLKQDVPNIKVRTTLRHGEVHEVTMECAEQEEAGMIVMGTHGHTGITHALLGSTAEKIVRLSKCPVLTVPNPDQES